MLSATQKCLQSPEKVYSHLRMPSITDEFHLPVEGFWRRIFTFRFLSLSMHEFSNIGALMSGVQRATRHLATDAALTL